MYAKLFTSIYQGTMRGQSDMLLVFTNLLAHADSVGHVDMHPRSIAEETGLPVERVRAAIDQLEAPDPDSRSPEENGRRLVRLDEHRAWGWLIVNYIKYRSIRNEEDRRQQNREAQERWRHKQRKPRKPESAQAEAEAEAEAEEYNTPPAPLTGGVSAFNQFWEAYPRKVAKKSAEAAFKKVEVSVDVLLAAVRRQEQKLEWQRGGGQYIPHAATWLNGRRWEDGETVLETKIVETWKPEPPMTPEQKAAADAARARVVSALLPRRTKRV